MASRWTMLCHTIRRFVYAVPAQHCPYTAATADALLSSLATNAPSSSSPTSPFSLFPSPPRPPTRPDPSALSLISPISVLELICIPLQLSTSLASLAATPSSQIADSLRLLGRKTALVDTALKSSVYSIVLQQQISEGADGEEGG